MLYADSIAKFRATLDQLDYPQYKLAARVDLNPPALNQILRRRRPMPPELERRIADELAKIEAERAGQ